jgi:undecaprenyl-diphosphatase
MIVLAAVAAFWGAVKYQSLVASYVDWPILLWLNGFASPSAFVNRAIEYTSDLPTFTGGFIIALFCYCWFRPGPMEQRADLLLGLAAAVLAVVLSRALQIGLPMHLRPLHDPAAGFVTPAGIDPAALNAWSSFPSDHATIFVALTVVVWRASSRLGVLALLATLFANIPRLYVGFHYPSDIAFGTMLGIALVMLATAYGPRLLARRVLAWGDAKPAMFHAIGFMVCFQVATLFVDIRRLGWIDPRHIGLNADIIRRLMGL